MKLILANFIHLLKRFKTSVVLNVLGLSVAFAVFTIIIIQSYRDITFNRSFSKIDNIEYLTLRYPSDGRKTMYLSYPIGERIDSVMPEIKNFCIISDWGEQPFNKDPQNKMAYSIRLVPTSRGFLDVFTPEITSGSTVGLFENNEYALISEKTAKKVFADEDPVGKQLYNHYNSENVYTIVGVYKDFPENCSIDNGLLIKSRYIDATEWSYRLYFDIIPGSRDIINEKINTAEVWGNEAMEKMKEDPTQEQEYFLSPLKNIFMDTPGNKASFLSLFAIGIAILFIACVNYLNFSVAMAPSRVKTVNIHKILGVKVPFLRFSIQMEGVLLALVAFVFALFYIYVFAGSPASSFFSADLSLSENIPILAIVGIILLIVVNFIGIYPAHYICSFPETMTVSGSFALSGRGVRLRNTLVTFQFTAAIFLICVAIFIKLQHDYMQKYNWGIEKNNIVYLPLTGLKSDFKTFAEEIRKSPEVIDYTASRFVPGKVHMGWGRDFQGKSVNFKAWPVLPNFPDFFGAKITAGDGFTKSANDSSKVDQIVLNEKFLEKYGFDYSIIGKDFPAWERRSIIKGIAGNVNFESVRYPIEPMAFFSFADNEQLNYIFFKLSGNNIPAAIKHIEQIWGQFSDDEFKILFLDEEIDRLYTNEANISKLISLFGFITIIIAVMGVYGLIVFNTRYKTKEIAIRKVNGATETEIIYMLNRDLLILLLISFVIAIPLAYYTINKWVESFAYKASVPWWLFPGVGLLVLIISVITISWQSWRAATANPVDALKNE